MDKVMTEYEIHKKIEQYKLSDAPIEVREKAIRELEAKLVSSHEVAKQQYLDGLPDTSDIGGEN